MFRKSALVLMLLFLALPMNQVLGGGKDVQVMLRNGHMIEGELLYVQDSLLCVQVETGSGMMAPAALTAGKMRIPFDQVALAKVEGNSRVLLGMGLGLVVGIVAGGAIGASQTEEPKEGLGALAYPMEVTGRAMAGALYGGLGGLAVGAMIGGTASTNEQTITQQTPGGLITLSQFARYPDGEPEFMKTIP